MEDCIPDKQYYEKKQIRGICVSRTQFYFFLTLFLFISDENSQSRPKEYFVENNSDLNRPESMPTNQNSHGNGIVSNGNGICIRGDSRRKQSGDFLHAKLDIPLASFSGELAGMDANNTQNDSGHYSYTTNLSSFEGGNRYQCGMGANSTQYDSGQYSHPRLSPFDEGIRHQRGESMVYKNDQQDSMQLDEERRFDDFYEMQIPNLLQQFSLRDISRLDPIDGASCSVPVCSAHGFCDSVDYPGLPEQSSPKSLSGLSEPRTMVDEIHSSYHNDGNHCHVTHPKQQEHIVSHHRHYPAASSPLQAHRHMSGRGEPCCPCREDSLVSSVLYSNKSASES